MAFRDRLVKTNVILKNTVKDLKEISGLVDTKFIIKESTEQQKLIERQIQNTERHIELILKEDEQLYKHFKLITSVVGIGLITAVSFLISTQNFTGRRPQHLKMADNSPAQRPLLRRNSFI